MAEDHGLARTPVLEVDPRAVLRREPVHPALLSTEGRPLTEHGGCQRCARRFTQRNEQCSRVWQRGGVEIDAVAVEELERLKHPLGCNHAGRWHDRSRLGWELERACLQPCLLRRAIVSTRSPIPSPKGPPKSPSAICVSSWTMSPR